MSKESPGQAPPLAEFDSAVLNRARRVLGLGEAQARLLPPRVELLWRKDNFAADIPFTNAMLLPADTADIGLLYESVARVVDRHEALRTRLAVKDGRAMQVAEAWKAPPFERTRVRREDLTDTRPGQSSAVVEFTQGTLDLYAQDGFRCQVFEDEEGNLTLGVLAHGFFADAWSSQTLLREIRAARTAMAEGGAFSPPPVPQYADYAGALRLSLEEGLADHLGYWRRKLAGMPPARLPRDRDGDTTRRGRSFFFLGQDIAKRLTAIAQVHRVSLMIVLLAAYQLTLARWSGRKEILSAAYTADRVKPQFHNTIGLLVTNMPVPSRIDPGMDLGAFLLQLSREYYDGYAHRELSCELYEAIFAPETPFCASVFNFVPMQRNFSDQDPFAVPAFDGIIATPDAARPAIYREIYLGLSQHPNGILGKVFCNAGHFSPDAIAGFIGHFRDVIDRIASGATLRTKDIVEPVR